MRLLDFAVRAEQIHSFLLLAARLEQKCARKFEIGDAARQRGFFVDRRHFRLGIEDMGNSVAFEHADRHPFAL